MNNLLKEALADAKAVRETAYANAKAVIEESFQPNLQRMISARLDEEEGEDEDLDIDVDFSMEDEPDGDEGGDTGFGSFGDEEEMPAEEETEVSDDEMELESLMRELDGMDGEEEDMMEGDEEGWEDPIQESDDEEVSDEEIYEMIVREMQDGGGSYEHDAPDGEMNTESAEGGGTYEHDAPNPQVNTEIRRLRAEVRQLKNQKNEAYLVVTKLKKTLNEVNLTNAKLLFNIKINRNFDLNKSQKTAIIESLDRANNVRECKLVYTTICESLNKAANKLKKRNVTGFASKPTPTVKSKLKEDFDFVPRWQQLAKIKPLND